MIDARDTPLATDFADLCCGLHRPAEGEVRFLQRDWSRQPMEMANALRGLIGRVHDEPGWLRFLDASTQYPDAQIHHTRTDLDTLYAEAAELAAHFGLPGLPSGSIARLSPGGPGSRRLSARLRRQPKLVILESPVQGLIEDMVLAAAQPVVGGRDRGALAIWLDRSRMDLG